MSFKVCECPHDCKEIAVRRVTRPYTGNSVIKGIPKYPGGELDIAVCEHCTFVGDYNFRPLDEPAKEEPTKEEPFLIYHRNRANGPCG